MSIKQLVSSPCVLLRHIFFSCCVVFTFSCSDDNLTLFPAIDPKVQHFSSSWLPVFFNEGLTDWSGLGSGGGFTTCEFGSDKTVKSENPNQTRSDWKGPKPPNGLHLVLSYTRKMVFINKWNCTTDYNKLSWTSCLLILVLWNSWQNYLKGHLLVSYIPHQQMEFDQMILHLNVCTVLGFQMTTIYAEYIRTKARTNQSLKIGITGCWVVCLCCQEETLSNITTAFVISWNFSCSLIRELLITSLKQRQKRVTLLKHYKTSSGGGWCELAGLCVLLLLEKPCFASHLHPTVRISF